MAIPILQPRHEWACPNCPVRDVTTESRPHSQMHQCAGMSGILAPLINARDVDNKGARVVAKIREDYIGRDKVEYDENGRPVSAVETQYADGRTDLAVHAPCINVEVIQ